MKSINRVSFLGHIVADPQFKTTTSGKPVSTFAVATNNEWFDAEGTIQKSVDFHRVVAWESLAELCAKYLAKGSPVYLEGRLSNRAYEGKDAMKHYITEVVLQDLHILKWKDNNKTVETEDLAKAAG